MLTIDPCCMKAYWLTIRPDSNFSEQTNTCEFRKAVNLAYGQGGLKLEINIPEQHILAKSKGGLIIEGGVISSEYGTAKNLNFSTMIVLTVAYAIVRLLGKHDLPAVL